MAISFTCGTSGFDHNLFGIVHTFNHQSELAFVGLEDHDIDDMIVVVSQSVQRGVFYHQCTV